MRPTVSKRDREDRWSQGLVALTFLVSFACAGAGVDPLDQVIDLRNHFLVGSFLPSETPLEGRPDDAPPAVEVRAAGQVLALTSSGSLVVPVDLFAGAAVLRFDFRFRGSGPSPGSISVSVLDSDGRQGQPTRLTHAVDVWDAAEIPVFGTNEVQFLVFKSALTEKSQSVEFRGPHMRLRAIVESSEGDQRASAVESSVLPNVLIVILDAARASNFGAYGYVRDTTPSIDELAAEGFVFRNAFSECPNTSCSIPNLISGIPFVDIGPPPSWHRISDQIVTLAEYLSGIGYRTIGLSANPNNAVARNTNQGFDEFFEMWAWEGPRRHPERRDPHRLSRFAIEAMRQVERTQPVFMLLHYMPPHKPYAPKPEFDIFGDPSYEGPVYPGVTFRDVRAGRQTLSPADVEEMVALYDGNLRMADDAVRELFDALREDQRWDNSIILITADHGEAFFEHGVQGHNSTLYNEMLHIPFILRLPEGRVEDGVDIDRLVILSDVVPTVLGQLGLEPHREVGGIDILRTADHPGPRVIVHRRAGEGEFAVRTPTWKAVFSHDGQNSMLFDLENDPDELHNLVEVRRLLYQGYAALLTRHRLEARARSFESEAVELSDQDLRELRSLGYLR